MVAEFDLADKEATIPFAPAGTVPVPGFFQPHAAKPPGPVIPFMVQFHLATALPGIRARLCSKLTCHEYVDDVVVAIACGTRSSSGRITIEVSGMDCFLRFSK